MIASVPFFIQPIFSHFYDFSTAIASLLFLNLPWRLFSVNPLILSSCIISSLHFFVSSSDKMFSLLSSFNIGFSFVLMYSVSLFLSSSTHFSTLIILLPPSYLFKCNLLKSSILDVVHHLLPLFFVFLYPSS